MNLLKSTIFALIIASRLLIAIYTDDGQKYVVFDGETCNIGGNYGRTCKILRQSGVLEVVREATGLYAVYFTNPYSNNDYTVLTTSNFQATGGAFSSIGGNDDSLDSYYGVSPYFVRIDTRRLGDGQRANSDYIAVVTGGFAGYGMKSVVYDGTNCPSNVCRIVQDNKVNGVEKLLSGFYKVVFDSPMSNANYLVFGSSNVWGTGGVITSIGGNNIRSHAQEGVTEPWVTMDTRAMHTGARAASDYVSVVVGTPSPGKKYVVFDGVGCNGDGVNGATCDIFSSNGVDEVQREGPGQYKVFWTNDFSNNNYVAICDSNVWYTGGTVCGFGGNNVGTSSSHGISTRFLEVQTRQMHNNAVGDSNYVSVIAFT